jgi:hypothetical protein
VTIADHRAACIKAMAIAWLRKRGYPETDIPDWLMKQTIEEQTAAFDSLHGLARVCIAEEMIIGGKRYWRAGHDLTKPPERLIP